MEEDGPIEVAVIDKTVYIKPVGYATQDNCLGLPGFLAAMSRQGCMRVTFDLKDCHGTDSTFLGVIASAAMSQERAGRKCVVVLNADERVQHELRMVGLTKVVAVTQEPFELPEDVRLKRIDFVHFPASERKCIEMIKRLHEEMIGLNQKNKELFSTFVEMLDKELREEDSEEG